MAEHTFDGKLTDSRDGFTATMSDAFRLIKIERGDGRGDLTLMANEAEAFAKWILHITPYGHRTIKD